MKILVLKTNKLDAKNADFTWLKKELSGNWIQRKLIQTDRNSRIGLRNISHCVRNEGNYPWTTVVRPRLELRCKTLISRNK